MDIWNCDNNPPQGYDKYKKVFVNPVTISLVIGLFLFITGIKLPGVINSTMAGVAAPNTPAAMIVLGYYLSCQDP